MTGNVQVHQKPLDLSLSVGKSILKIEILYRGGFGRLQHALVYAKVKKGKNIEIV